MVKMEVLKVSAPGKVILHGEHAVVYGKPAIAVSVGLYTTLTISPADQVQLKFEEVGLNLTLDTESLNELKRKLGPAFQFDILNASKEIPISEVAKQALSDYCESRQDFKNCPDGLLPAQKAAFQSFLFSYLSIFDSITPYCFLIETDLPVGAGLGSSASFAVALAGGLLIAAKKETNNAFNLENINRWAFVTEKFVHGSPSGVDNSVASYGGGILFRKGEPIQHIVDCPDIRVLLVNTKIPRSTKVLVSKVAALKETNPDLFLQSMDEIEAIVGKCVKEIQDKKAVDATLISRNQELLSILGVSHPSLDKIVELARSHGLSAKLTGAGGGGCAFIYIPSNRTTDSTEPLLHTLRENQFEFWDTILGCRGFTVC